MYSSTPREPSADAQVTDARKEYFVSPMNLADLRTDYRRGKLEREDLDVDPIDQPSVTAPKQTRQWTTRPSTIRKTT